jgi:NADH pyrophosphatase NudC (nudix superfamily)
MWEETGLLVKPVRILGVYGGPEFRWQYSNGDKVAYVMIVFEGNVIGGAPARGEDEVLEIGYFSEGELAQLSRAEWLKMVLADAFGKKREASFGAPSWRPA